MNKEDNFGRLLMLLLITLCICLGLYYLPDNMFGQKIKKVDLLSDLRVKTQSLSMDSLRKQLEQPDTLEIDSVALRDSIIRSTGIDSTALVLRDSLYNIMYSVQGADSLGTHIEDYSVGHIGLKRFFTALKNRETMNRPVRVAFLGDSFIEGGYCRCRPAFCLAERVWRAWSGLCSYCFRGSTVPSDYRTALGRMAHLVDADRP